MRPKTSKPLASFYILVNGKDAGSSFSKSAAISSAKREVTATNSVLVWSRLGVVASWKNGKKIK